MPTKITTVQQSTRGTGEIRNWQMIFFAASVETNVNICGQN